MTSNKESMKSLLNTMQNKSIFNVDLYSEKEDDPFKWKVLFEGPLGSIYEGGFFMVKIVFSPDYPQSRPSAYFMNRIFHPHVYIGDINNFKGDICLNIVNKDINSVLFAILEMFNLYDKDVDHGYTWEEPAKLFKENNGREKFIAKAKNWVRQYAKLEDIDKFYDL